MFEKILEKLEYLQKDKYVMAPTVCYVLENVKEIVKEVAKKYDDGWIPVEERLPKENGWYWGYYVTSSYRGTDGVRRTECKYASIYWEDNLWLYDARGFRTVDEVIAWKPIAPYQKGETHEHK